MLINISHSTWSTDYNEIQRKVRALFNFFSNCFFARCSTKYFYFNPALARQIWIRIVQGYLFPSVFGVLKQKRLMENFFIRFIKNEIEIKYISRFDIRDKSHFGFDNIYICDTRQFSKCNIYYYCIYLVDIWELRKINL